MQWHESEKYVRRKENGSVSVRLYNARQEFVSSVNVPTAYYPLAGNKAEVFTYQNTKQVTDPAVLAAFDNAKANLGRCYENAASLVKSFAKAGIDIVPYSGWLFTDFFQPPVHHCWCVVNGDSVLDLSDDFGLMMSGKNGQLFREVENSKEDTINLLIEFRKWASKLKNSERCAPVGQTAPFLLYVGTPCEPMKAKQMYNDLLKEYPWHETHANVGSDGKNSVQRRLADNGLFV